MEKTPSLFRPSVRAGLATFRAALVPILIFEVIYRAATALVVRPLFAMVAQLFLQLGGDSLAFNDSIWRFALSGPSAASRGPGRCCSPCMVWACCPW